MHQIRDECEHSDADSNAGVNVSQEVPSRKRYKKDSKTSVVCNIVLYMILS
jgi:hypothetical protein